MEIKKKQWQKPELIVPVRSKPEEAVLMTCRGAGKDGPASEFNACLMSFCQDPCEDNVGS